MSHLPLAPVPFRRARIRHAARIRSTPWPRAALACLLKAQQARDSLSAGRAVATHEEQVARLAALLADAVGFDSARIDTIRRAAGSHDVGKLGVPDTILLKAGPLDTDEWRALRAHTVLGGAMLSGHGDPTLDLAASIAQWHHEAYDGNGYPDGLAGEAIPIEARLVAVADVYDALRQQRSYRHALSHREALDIMRHGDARTSPARFDPAMLGAFLDAERHVESAWELGNGA